MICSCLYTQHSNKPIYYNLRKHRSHIFSNYIIVIQYSFSYLIFDLLVATFFYYTATTYFSLLPPPLSYFAWPLYWASQGCVFLGVWAIAHECGHHAFSDYQWLDNAVGFILHSLLLVPFFSWKYSHRRHHSNAGSLERDEVHVPKQKFEVKWYIKYFNNPLGRTVVLIVQFAIGWPLYLAFNVSGRHYDGFASHFYPNSPIFNDSERLQIYISDAGILAVCYCLCRYAVAQGTASMVICVYGVPLLVANGILVLITSVQHTHPSLPHYDSSEWDWFSGAFVTVDRDLGILNKVFHHNLTDTHVAHHLFSTVPHYHAVEVTKAIKPILGDYYQFDGTPFLKAMWREAKECIYVERDGEGEKKGVFWYNNKF